MSNSRRPRDPGGLRRAAAKRAENDARLRIVASGVCPACGAALVQNKFGLGEKHWDCAQYGRLASECGIDYRDHALPACGWSGISIMSPFDLGTDAERAALLAEWAKK